MLSGASSQWKGARPGKVFETLVDGACANPVMVVDEIDKARAEHAYDPLGALHSLLEIDTAGAFADEFAEVAIDASLVICVATANDARAIPKPILIRMNVSEIDAPDADAARAIALRLYQQMRAQHGWGQRFDEEPAEFVLERLSGLGPTRNAPCLDDGVWQCPSCRARRGGSGGPARWRGTALAHRLHAVILAMHRAGTTGP